MRLAKNILLFATAGLAVTLAIAGLASIAPGVFGWLTLPFWLLPALASLGAHDVGWTLMLISGTICYGFIAFLIYQLQRHVHR
jgi:hypothetical protein